MSEAPDTQVEGVAIVALAGRFPKADTLEQFWDNLRSGVESSSVFTDAEMLAEGADPTILLQQEYVRAGFVLDGVDRFDAGFFDLSAREAEILDPQHRLFLECAWEALERAGYASDANRGTVSVFAGAGASSYLYVNLLSRPDVVHSVGSFQVAIANDKDFLPPRVSHQLGLRGPSVAVQTACSSSLVAVHLACQSLLTGESEIALAGGVSIAFPGRAGYAHQQGGVLSPDGHCRAFDARAAGTVRGSGAGVVVLKRLADALTAGDTIHAVIRGSAVNNDGDARLGYTAPSVEGQAAVISEALGMADVDPETVQYIEAHGTATPLGDPIEIAALTRAFRSRARRESKAYCAVGSVKTNIGHLDAAAGIAGLIKTVLALEHQEIPPSLHFDTPNPQIDFPNSPFFVNNLLRPWPSEGGRPRRAAVSSFGIGGTNAHVVLEEAPHRRALEGDPSPQLLVLSAVTAPALEAATANLAAWLDAHSEQPLSDVAYSLQVGRRRFKHRRVVVCGDTRDARDALTEGDSRRLLSEVQETTSRPLVFLFPGQGAQYPGMGRELYESESVFRAHVDACCERLHAAFGLDIRQALFPGAPSAHAEERLAQTAVTQPALFIIEYALAQLWLSLGLTPSAMIGHSLGEYVAACIAGVLSLEDALALVAVRGQLMQSLPRGAMVSVMLSEPELRPLLAPGLSVAAINGPSLCVVSGPVEIVRELESAFTQRKVEVHRLHTSHAFHSGMMDPILDAFAARTRDVHFSPPKLPYVSNLTGSWITEQETMNPNYWVEHLRQCVRFGDGAKLLLEDEASVFLEVGPGTSLSELLRQVAGQSKRRTVLSSLRHPREADTGRARFLETVGRLWLAGAPLVWNGLHPPARRRRVALPTYAFQREKYWIEPGIRGEPTGARPPSSAGVQRKQGTVGDWFYVPGWKQVPPPVLRASPARWLVLLHDRIGPRVVEHLEAAGHDVVAVAAATVYERPAAKRFTIVPGEPEHHDRVLTALGREGWVPQRVVYLWHAEPDEQNEEVVESGMRAFHDLLHLARALHTQVGPQQVELVVVTNGVHDVLGDEPLHPASALLLGACKVLPQEFHPKLRVRQIDAGPARRSSEQFVRQLVADLEAEEQHPVVAHRGDRRYVEIFERARPPEPGTGLLRERGVYVIIGGLGRLGLAIADELGSAFRARLVLVGRSAFPSPEEWAGWLATHADSDQISGRIRRLLALQQRGAEVMVVRADVSRLQDVHAIFERARTRFGEVHGVIHSAGSIGERTAVPILGSQDSQHDDQFQAKVCGVLALERALRGCPLDFVLLQSSLSAVLGGLGFAAYAAANLFMDAFCAQQARRDGPPWFSVNWDGWSDGDAFDPERMALKQAEGIEAFRRVLSGSVRRWVVSTGDLASRLATWVQPTARPHREGPMTAAHQRPRISTDYIAPGSHLEQELATLWEELLGVKPIGIHDGFFELGGHSLLGTQLLSRVRETYRVDVPIRALFETPTVRGLAKAIAGGRVERDGRDAALPTKPDGSSSRAPLSFAQQRLWLFERLEPNTAVYNIHTVLRCEGALDEGALVRSLKALVTRHAALRTTIVEEGDQVFQMVEPRLDHLEVPVVDLRELTDRARSEARRLAEEQGREPFDLKTGPLFRAKLLRLGPFERLLALTIHHSAFDAWSLGLIIRELVELYSAFISERRPVLPALTLQYTDYARWQRDRFQGQVLERELEYWRAQLAGAPLALDLPTDRPRPSVPSYAGASLPLAVPRELTDALEEIGQREGATLFMVLLAALQTVLSRYSGQDDVSVCTPIAGRNRVELEGIVGCFINTLVLRTRLSGNPTFRELLGRVREVTLEAFSHQDMPFDKLVEALPPPRSRSRLAFSQVVLRLQNAPVPELALPGGIKIQPVELTEEAANCDLNLSFAEAVDGLHGTLRYSTLLFDRSTALRLIEHLRSLLAAVVADPDQRLDDLPFLSSDEIVALERLEQGRSPVAEATVLDRFHAWATRTPKAVAAAIGDRTVSYEDIARRGAALACRLAQLGVPQGAPVAVFLPRSPDLLAALVGVLEAGAAYLPLDPSYPSARLSHMLDDAQPLVVVTDPLRLKLLSELWRERALVIADLADAPIPPARIQIPRNLPSHIVYTSGSTGVPKGIVSHHGALLNYIDYLDGAYDLSASDVALQLAPASFDASLRDMLAPILFGGRVVFAEGERGRDPEDLLALIERHQVTVLPSLVPSLLRLLVASASAAPRRLASVRLILCSGERLLGADIQRAHAAFGTQARVINQYGPSECTLTSTYHPASSDHDASLVPVGRPIGNAEILVLDGRGKRVPPGIVGQIHIGGRGLSHGYLGRPDLTAERFVPNPFTHNPGARLYVTGDYGRWQSGGTLELVGRRDDQVKVRGNRVELGEIESTLLRHPRVRESVVLAVPEPDGGVRVVACVVLASGEPTSDTELGSFLSAHLPEPALPSAYAVLAELPRTPNGKVDRAALLPAAEGARRSSPNGTGSAAPRTATEEILSGIWAQLLRLDRVGLHDSFFDLGGHSLLATQAVSRMRGALKVELPLREIFEHSTVEALAARVDQLARRSDPRVGAPSLVPVPRTKNQPLSFAQNRLWVLDRMRPGNPAYNISGAVRLQGYLDANVLERCFEEIIRRHESLRTTFQLEGDGPVQRVWAELSIPLRVVDLAGLPEGARAGEMQRLVAEEARWHFDLGRGPLVRLTLLRLSDGDHVLALVMHHIISDGWSRGVLLRELMTLHSAFLAGKPSPLLEPSVQYADFACWQREWLRDDVFSTQLSYWRRELEGIPPVLPLPTDRKRPLVLSQEGAHHRTVLPPTLTEALRRLAGAEGATLFMTLMAAFQALLSRYAGVDDVPIGTDIAGRNHIDTEGVVGFFVNQLVIRGRLGGNPTFRQLLSRIRDSSLEAYAHQDLPFEELVRAINPERSLAHAPLFQVKLVLENMPIPDLHLEGLSLVGVPFENATSKFDLTLVLEEWEGGLVGLWEYSTDLFDAQTIARMADSFQRVLEAAATTPDIRLSALPILSADERQRLVVGWNAACLDLPPEGCAHHLFTDQARRTPEAPAVAFRGNTWTYLEVQRRANQVAHHLRELGVGPEVRVGVCLERSLEMVVAMLGVLEAGGAFVPLDPGYPADRLALLLREAAVPVLLTQEHLLTELPLGTELAVCLDSGWAEIARQPEQALSIDVRPQNLAYVIFTSGSTGQPKGVMLAHRGLCNTAITQVAAFHIGPGSRVLQTAALGFDASVAEIFATLAGGGCLHLASREEMMPGPPLHGLLAKEAITTVTLTPSVLALLDAHDLPTLGTVISAGEPCTPEIAVRWKVGRKLLNAYGPTEITVCASVCPDVAVERPSIGRPLPNVQLYVLDSRLEPVPVGVKGELFVGGVGVARGYLGQPALTAERFLPSPFAQKSGERLYRTGDMVRYLPSGELEFLGRADEQVKIRGFRVEPGEVDSVLSQHPGLSKVVVTAGPDSSGNQRLVAYFLALPDANLTIEDLRAYTRARLPDHLVPSTWVALSALPLTPHGKVDVRALPAPEAVHGNEQRKRLPPRTPFEEIVAQVWADLLHREWVGVDDDFFDLGGHSLLATQVAARLSALFGSELTLNDIFGHPTAAALAEHLESRGSAVQCACAPVSASPLSEVVPVSVRQGAYWSPNQPAPDDLVNSCPALFRLEGPFDAPVLQQSLREMVRRHEILRTTFPTEGGTPIQRIAPAGDLPLEFVDLGHLAEPEAATFRLVHSELQRPFDLARGPLTRCSLFRLSDHSHVLLLNQHHAITDYVSLSVFMFEVATLYAAFREEQPSPLPEPILQYRDYIRWEQEWLRTERLEQIRTYWRRRLLGPVPEVALPYDQPLRPEDDLLSAVHPFELSPHITRALRTLCRRESVTPFVLILTAFQGLLSRYGGQEDICVGFSHALRQRPELETMLGMFAGYLVIRTDLSGNPSFREMLRRVRANYLEAFQHQGLPHAELVELLPRPWQVSFSFTSLEDQGLSAVSDLSVAPGVLTRGRMRSDLKLNIMASSDRLGGTFEYRTACFEATTIATMQQHLMRLLESVVDESDRSLSDLLHRPESWVAPQTYSVGTQPEI